MNRTDIDLDDDRFFDRLVDGELDGHEYRQLLAALDEEPGGWRRCAMAFLEAQAWGSELRGLQLGVEPPVIVEKVAPKALRVNYVALLLATVASFGLVFALGWHFLRTPADQPDAPHIAGNQSVASPATDALAGPSVLPVSQDSMGGQPLGLATFVVDRDDGSAEEIEVPVFETDNDYGRMVLENSTRIPPHIRHELRRRGLDVRRDLRWVPVELGGGRRMVVPFGEVEITPVSSTAFH